MNVAARDEIIETQGSIDNLAHFLYWVDSGTKARLTNKTFVLEIQKKIKGRDPIEYLHDLYYNQKKSLNEIIKTLNDRGVETVSKATLHRLLFIHFGWIPRSNTERTPVHDKQLSEKIQSEVAEFESKVKDLLEGRETKRVFKMSEFNQKDYRAGKALYILKTLGGIDKSVLYRASIESKIGNTRIADALNIQLQSILFKYPYLNIDFEDVKLSSQSITRWFKYNADKLKAA